METTRQPIISVLGHVDHGKTSILDKVRDSAVASREEGGITQHIGATEVPMDVVQKVCGGMLKATGSSFSMPGLLFVDTPGHEAFTNLRKRGGSIADLAVLVIDLREGFKPQSLEALEILKSYKTPFVIAANKVDLMDGWDVRGGMSFMKSYKEQRDFVRERIETKIYELIGKLSELGIESERFDRVGDFTKQVAIIPCSAKSGEGVAELLMVLTGLSQRYLEKNLHIQVSGPGRGSILEVKEERGFGTSLDVILYDGKIKRGDTVILSGLNGAIETKVKALLKPKPLDEMRDPKDKFDNITELVAASGVKVIGPGIDDALPGGQLFVAGDDAEQLKEQINAELGAVRFEKENLGLIVRADTLGSLEASLKIFGDMGVPIRKADIGAVSKKDVIEAESLRRQKPEFGAIISFGVTTPGDVKQMAKDKGVRIIENKVIYHIIEEYEKWEEDAKKTQEMNIFERIPFPSKLRFLDGCTFRRSGPCIVGLEVLSGKIRPGYRLMKTDGTRIGRIESLQDKSEKVETAEKGMQVAVAIDGPQVGRQIFEGDEFLTFITQSEYEEILKKGKRFLDGDAEALLREIRKIAKSE